MNSSNISAPEGLNAIRFIKMLIRWRKQLLIVFSASLVGGFLLTFFITPLYKSTAVVYPYNLGVYSKESATEQMVQLFKSEDVAQMLIKAFDLYKHYDIDTAGSSPRFKIMQKLEENITVRKTEYESVELNILDADPLIAARMCDSMIAFMDKKALSLIREKSAENIVIFKRQVDEKKTEMDSMVSLQTSLSTNYGILDYENQVLGFSREYYQALSNGSSSRRMEEIRKNLEEKGNESFSLKENLWRMRGQYNDLKKVYEAELANLNKTVTFHNLVTSAVPAEKKDSPKRALLALLFMLSVMVVAILVIIYHDYYKTKFEADLKE